MNVTITGTEANIIPTGEGFANKATPTEVLMHELASHAEPRIMGNMGNAIEIENSIRLELSEKNDGEGPLQRIADETHGTHGGL